MFTAFLGIEIKISYNKHFVILRWKRQRKPLILKKIFINNCFEVKNRFLTHNGYPKMKFKNKTWRINRFMYCLYYQQSPDDIKNYVLCHTCDNRLCVNPEHLIKSTQDYNMKDMVNKNRSPIGERNSRAKLTENDVNFILDSEMNNNELAIVFEVTSRTIKNVRKKLTWKHVERKAK